MKLFALSDIKKLTSEKVYKRGMQYFKTHKVKTIKYITKADFITAEAEIQGTYKYSAQISWNQQIGSIKKYKCNCPYDWMDMCKHCVALALTINNDTALNSQILLQNNQEYKEEDIQIYFSGCVNEQFQFKVKYVPNNEWIRDIPQQWIKSIRNIKNKEFAHFLFFHTFFRNNVFCIKRGKEHELFDYFQYADFIQDLEMKKKIIFKSTHKPLPFLMEWDANVGGIRITIQKGFCMPKEKINFFYYDEAVFYITTDIQDEWKKYDLYDLIYTISVKGVTIPLEYYDFFVTNLFPCLEKWNKQNILLPSLPEIKKDKTFDINVYIKKIETPWREEYIELQYFYDYKQYQYPIVQNAFQGIEACRNSLAQERIEDFSFMDNDFLKTSFKNFNHDTILKNEYRFEDRIYALFENTANNDSIFIPRDYIKDTSIITLLAEFEGQYDLEENRIAFAFPSKSLQKFGKKLHKQALEHNWHLHFAKNIPSLQFSKKKLTVNFDIIMNNAGLLEFDMDIHLKNHNITEQQLQNMLFGVKPVEINGEFIELANKKDLQRVLSFTEKIKKDSKGKYKIPLWSMAEIEGIIDESKSFHVQRDKRYDSFLQEAKEGKPVQVVKIPKHLDTILRDYQKRGVNWLHFLRKYHFGGILADDMGLGKTLQVLAYIESLSSKKLFVIVCPKTLIFNWESEIEKFCPKLKYISIHGNSNSRKKQIQKGVLKKYNICITSYSLLKQDIQHWINKKIDIDTIFIDEAQHIKNFKSKTSKAVKLLPTNYRVSLTGTPLENGVADIWSIFDFLMHGFLDVYQNFRTDYEKPISYNGDTNILQLLHRKVQPFLLRREKMEILKELPAKIEQEVHAELSKEQLKLYTKVLTEVRENVFQKVETEGFNKSRIHILAALMKLRQICNHPSHVVENMEHASSGKVDLCLELLEDALQGNHKVLIFSSFVKTLHLLRSCLKKEKIDFCYLDGQTINRRDEIKSFNEDPKKSVFLISLKAGGTGLNLTSADTVIIFDPWWNPMVEMQAMDRAHRMGQKNVVNVYSLITKNTIEEKMLIIKERKKKIFQGMVGKNDEYIKKLSWEDIRDLFS
jgi:SNF2 family DNA or RNA helicase